jgi:membrane-bound ClpP family serine protease
MSSKIVDSIVSGPMLGEALFKMGGMAMVLLGILLLVVGLFTAGNFLEATGLTAIVMGFILLYYAWMKEDLKPREEEPRFEILAAKDIPVMKTKTGK